MTFCLRVVELFDSLQGEGVWAGTPMTFVRLAGCNATEIGLACTVWCDTKYAWSSEPAEDWDPEVLASQLSLPRCCVTGGEPLLQQEGLARFIHAAHQRGVAVHLETNGTIDLLLDPGPDWLTVSPKPPRFEVAPVVADRADEVKFILDDGLAALGVQGVVERLLPLAERFAGRPICIQPEGGAGLDRARLAAAVVLAHPSWRLSLQLHRILGLR